MGPHGDGLKSGCSPIQRFFLCVTYVPMVEHREVGDAIGDGNHGSNSGTHYRNGPPSGRGSNPETRGVVVAVIGDNPMRPLGRGHAQKDLGSE